MTIIRKTWAEINQGLSTWDKRSKSLAHTPDEDIDTSGIPELTEDFWKNARVRYPTGSKERLSVVFDEDIVQWFRAQGRDYRDQMNAVLRSFYEAHRDRYGSYSLRGKRVVDFLLP